MATVYNYLHRKVPCHPVYTSLRHQMEEKISKAIENGDKNEETRLKGFYSDMNPSYYLLESPIKIGSDYRFCFYNRQFGFAKLDMLVTDKTVSFEEYMADLGYKTNILTTKESWTEFKLSFGQGNKELSLVKLNFLTDQPLIFVSKKNRVDHDLNFLVYQWGFDNCSIRYDNARANIENWAFAEVYCKALNIPGDKRVKFYTTQGVDKLINKVVEADVVWENNPDPINVFEMPEYTEGLSFHPGFTFMVQGGAVTDKSKITITDKATDLPVAFEMDSAGVINFKHLPKKPPHINSKFIPDTTALYRIMYSSNEINAEVDVAISLVNIFDNTRVSVTTPTGVKNGSNVNISLNVLDTYYPDQSVNASSNVEFVLRGKATGVPCNIVNGVLTTSVPFTEGLQFIDGYIKFNGINGPRCVTVPQITVPNSNPAK